MLRFFTEALGSYLLSRIPDAPDTLTVSYALPGAIPGKDAINLFFYALEEDADLRSNEKQYEQKAYGWIAIPPPLRLKCTYLVSAWPAAGDNEEAALTQASLLGAAYCALVSAGAMPLTFLPAPLNAPGLPKPAVSLMDTPLPDITAFWPSVGCAYRPSFSFTSTISIPVTEDLREYTVEGLQIGYIIK